jgi:hypothetical protein
MEVPAPKGIKALVGRKQTKNFKFVGEDVTVSKLTVAQVKQIQVAAKGVDENAEDDDAGLEVLRTVIRSAVEGGSELSDADFETFPIDELRNLSRSIMQFSGIAPEDEGK